jgi:transcriptional regulator with XRE-family HTH domain
MVKNISNNNPQPVHFFCENLKYLLKKFGINQTDLATHIDRQQTTVSNWINGISVPDVDDLVKIYHYFGFGIDALVLMDLSKSQVVTDKYVARFKKMHHSDESAVENMMEEPDAAFNESVIEQLKNMDGKLDNLQEMTKRLVNTEKKQVKK